VTAAVRIRQTATTVANQRDTALDRPVHDNRTAAILGIALGLSFTVCFLTGLFSHAMQHPPSRFEASPRPAELYRITQGTHVATGIATIPLLLAKLWSVYPRFFRPFPRAGAAIIERISLVPLVGGAVFMLFTGVTNIARWYVWPFFFPTAHFWAAWITIGALLVHIGARGGTARAALRRKEGVAVPREDQALSRRTFLVATGIASAGLVLTTVGQTFSPLKRLVLFAPRRPDIGSQGLPVNKAAIEAGVVAAATAPDYRLTVDVDGTPQFTLSLQDLESLPRHEATLPIACVEGWSATASWQGVRVRDVLDRARAGDLGDRTVEVISLEDGLYASSTLTAAQANDRDTLLALFVNGERLNLDHGYPVRLIAPNRPGVLQTKWVHRMVVR
jgi:hypothetical protein